MPTQAERASLFRSLHKKGDPIVLYNIWDAGSAKAVVESGARAVATGSAPVAMANGYPDGEKFPLQDALGVVARILQGVDVPVTMDLEGGYGTAPDTVFSTVKRAIEVGVVGFNFEDQIVGGEGLYSLQEQVLRIKAARRAADENSIGGFLNARTDIFLKAKPDQHTESMVDAAIERADAYAQAGADGFFVPGMVDKKQIARLCAAVSLPVNLIVLAHTPSQHEFTELGASRVSYGPTPYRQMIAWFGEQARRAYPQA